MQRAHPMALTSACSVGMWAATPDCLVFFLCSSTWHIEEAFGSCFRGSPGSELSPAKKAPGKKLPYYQDTITF